MPRLSSAALRLAASFLYYSKSALEAFHRRLKARLGAPKAITATAHKLARLIYRMLPPSNGANGFPVRRFPVRFTG
jgi:transposase